MSDEVHFFHADKHQGFLQVDTRCLWVWQDMFKVPRQFSNILAISQKKAKNILVFDCNALLDLVPFVQFKKRKKHP